MSKLFPPFWKRVYTKRKEYAPPGSNFFPFRVDTFQRRLSVQGSKRKSSTKLSSFQEKTRNPLSLSRLCKCTGLSEYWFISDVFFIDTYVYPLKRQSQQQQATFWYFFCYFWEKKRLDISWKASMKCQTLFLWKKKKNLSQCHLQQICMAFRVTIRR